MPIDPLGIESGGTATLAPPKADPLGIEVPARPDPLGIETHASAKPDPLNIERPTTSSLAVPANVMRDPHAPTTATEQATTAQPPQITSDLANAGTGIVAGMQRLAAASREQEGNATLRHYGTERADVPVAQTKTIVAPDLENTTATRDAAAQRESQAYGQIQNPVIKAAAPMVTTIGAPMVAGAASPLAGAAVAGEMQKQSAYDATERQMRQMGATPQQSQQVGEATGNAAGTGAAAVSLIPGVGKGLAPAIGHSAATGYGFDMSDQVAQHLATGRPISQMEGLQAAGFGAVMGGAVKFLHVAFKGKPPQEHVDAVSRSTTPEEVQAAVEDARSKLGQATAPVNDRLRSDIFDQVEASAARPATAPPPVPPAAPTPKPDPLGIETTASTENKTAETPVVNQQTTSPPPAQPLPTQAAPVLEQPPPTTTAPPVVEAKGGETTATPRRPTAADIADEPLKDARAELSAWDAKQPKANNPAFDLKGMTKRAQQANRLARKYGVDVGELLGVGDIEGSLSEQHPRAPEPQATARDPNIPNPMLGTDARGNPISASQLRVVDENGNVRGKPPAKPAPDEPLLSKAERDALGAPLDETPKPAATGQQFRVSGPEGKFYVESRAPKGKWQTASKYGETFPTKEAAGARLAELQGGKSFPRKGQPISPSETGVAGGADEGPTAAAYSGGTPETTTDKPNWFGNKREQLAAKLNAIRDGVQRFSGRMFPTMTRLARPSGEAAARYVASPIYAKEAAPQISNEIINGPDASRGLFGKVKLDPETDRLAGAVRVEDALRGTKDKFIKQARAASAEAQKAKTAEGRTAAVELYKDAMASAGKVKTLVGAEGSPFKTEAEYQGAKAKTADIQKRYGEWAKGEPEANYRASQDITPEEDLPKLAHELEGHTNLIAVDPETVDKKNTIRVSEAGRGNLRNPLEKPSPFARERKGTAAAYDIRLSQMIRNTLGRGTERANQSRLYDQLVADGLAVKGKPTDRPTIDGKPTRPIDLKRRTIVTKGGSFAQNEVLHVRADVYPELRRALNVDEKAYIPIVSEAGNIATRTALASFVESSSHVANQAGALFQGAGVRRMLVNLPVRMVQLVRGNPEIYARSLELARIGAERDTARLTKNPLTWTGKLIDFTDKAGRLVIEDAVRSRQARGLVPNTETAVRDAVNAFGQYNARAQAGVIAAARETGLGPFATAASNFYAMGMRAMTLDPGMTAASRGAAVRLRAEVLARYAGTLGLVAAANYLKWGRVDGGPGVPFGSLRTGTDDKGNAKYVNIFKLTPGGRGYRDSGAEALVDSLSRDKTAGQTIDAVAPAIAKGPVRAFEGPIVNAAAVAATGHSAEGYPIAKKAPPGESQVLENLKAAGKQLNPMVRSATDTRGNWTDQLGKFAPKTARARSDAERMVSDILKARGEAEYTAEQEQRFNARRDYADKMRAGDQQARAALAADKTLTPQDKVRARDMARMTRLQYDMKHDSLTAEEAVKVYQAATDQERQQIRTLVIGKIARSSSVSPQRRNELRRAVMSSATRPAA